MMTRHYGPESAYNCSLTFVDNDRKNIEHLWLVEHGSPSFLPAGKFDASQESAYIPEANPEGSLPTFTWTPIDPDRQHYTIGINCRDGVFEESWEVTRVDGVLRSRIQIQRGAEWRRKNPSLDPIVFKMADPEFVETPLASVRPNEIKKAAAPGWKPNHRFEVPVAIIDPNGNFQIMSAVKLPDGSTRTDFGTWNLLTEHFGDKPAKRQ